MDKSLFHIFRNTPLGRETLLQSAYFCKTVRAYPVIYIPKTTKFLMYFENDVVQVDLDDTYLTSPKTARQHAAEIVEQAGIKPVFFEPKHYTASTLPDIPTHFDFMCCPRTISDLSHKIGLGYIGPRVRRVVQAASFPVLIPSPAYKEWKSITVFFGGSANAVNALRLGINLSRATGMKLNVFTQIGRRKADYYEKVIADSGLENDTQRYIKNWHRFESGKFKENLYDVPHDALVIMGAFGHGLIRDFIFGSKMETIQSTVTNSMLIAGPNYITRL